MSTELEIKKLKHRGRKVRTTRYLKNLGRSQSLVSKFTFLKIAEHCKELLFMWIISIDNYCTKINF